MWHTIPLLSRRKKSFLFFFFCILVPHSTPSCSTQWRKTEDSHYRHVRATFQTIQLPERGYWWRYRYITSWKLYFMSETSYISFLPDSCYFVLPRDTKNFIFCKNKTAIFLFLEKKKKKNRISSFDVVEKCLSNRKISIYKQIYFILI